MLGLAKQVKVVRANASGWSDNNPEARFDLVIVDPPYDDVQPALLHKLARHVKKCRLVHCVVASRVGVGIGWIRV